MPWVASEVGDNREHSALIIGDGKEGEGSCNDQRALDRPSPSTSAALAALSVAPLTRPNSRCDRIELPAGLRRTLSGGQ